MSEDEFLSEDEDTAIAGSHCFLPMTHPPSVSVSPIPPRVLSFSPRVQTRSIPPGQSKRTWEQLTLKLCNCATLLVRRDIRKFCPHLAAMKKVILKPALLHAARNISVMPLGAPLVSSMLAVRSPQHNGSVVHFYKTQCQISVKPDRPKMLQRLGPVMDTGAERSASKHSDEIISHTNSSFNMQSAIGSHVTSMKGVLMGAETRDMDDVPLLLVVPDVSVSDPLLSDSLISVGRLMEAGFKVLFRVPCEAHLDGFLPSRYPKYGGKITTPQGRVIIMDYESHTWRLPPPLISKTAPLKATPIFNSFSLLENMGEEATDANDHCGRKSEADQRKFELMLSREKEVQVLHESHGHPHNKALYDDLIAAGVEVRHLQRYIMKHKCKFCTAARGKRSYKITKKTNSGSLILTPLVNSENPDITITESLAHLFPSVVQEKPKSTPSVLTEYLHNSLLAFTEQNAAALNAAGVSCVFTDNLATITPTGPPPPATLWPPLGEPGSDLRMDWADSCSLGRHGERYFLLVVDKGTEYYVNFNTKRRESPVDLLREIGRAHV